MSERKLLELLPQIAEWKHLPAERLADLVIRRKAPSQDVNQAIEWMASVAPDVLAVDKRNPRYIGYIKTCVPGVKEGKNQWGRKLVTDMLGYCRTVAGWYRKPSIYLTEKCVVWLSKVHWEILKNLIVAMGITVDARCDGGWAKTMSIRREPSCNASGVCRVSHHRVRMRLHRYEERRRVLLAWKKGPLNGLPRDIIRMITAMVITLPDEEQLRPRENYRVW